MSKATALIVRRDNLLDCKIVELEKATLAEGEAELSVDRFGFTSNNVTYGAIGEALAYWNFFPTGIDGWGCIPVWGFGTVIQSRSPSVAVGDRFFGYYPMATRLVVTPGEPIPTGFSDTAAHRKPMSPIYNRYARTATDPVYRPEDEAFLALYRPLFGTAFFIDDMLAESQFYGAKTLIFSSASSKTAYCTAFLLSGRRRAGADIETVGLTSPGNIAFVKQLGVYDRVLAYEEVAELERKRAAFFDMAGNTGVRAAVHRHFSDALTHSSIVGRTHWSETAGGGEKLPGAEPEMLFIPTWIQKRTGELSPGVVQEWIGKAWASLLTKLRDPKSGWLEVVEAAGPAAVEKTYRDVVAGRFKPVQGHILSLNG
jgi:uncharacterized protein DUF2855